MRRLIVCFVVACLTAVPAASVASAKNGRGTLCVLHAKLSAKNETTNSTSTAKGHTLIKVRMDGTIEFKTQINNKAHETFIAGHIHQAPVGSPGPIVVPLFLGPATSARHIKQSGVATPNPTPPTATGAQLCQSPSAYYVNYHTTAFMGGAIRGQLH
jgi:CHRD domain